MRFSIRRRQAVVAALFGPLLALALLLAPATAQTATTASIDALFTQLRLAPDAAAAKSIDQQIWAYWMSPADPVLNARMKAALAKLGSDPSSAVPDIESITKDYPDYAEGWNQLATVHFILGDYVDSLADIDRVLALEPRHFGALSGRALIYRNQGKRGLAVRSRAAALAVHPFLAERKLFPELLEEVTRI